MQTTVLYSVFKDEEGWEDHARTFKNGAEAALLLSNNPSGDDPTRITMIDYANQVHVVHQRGKWVTSKWPETLGQVEAEWPGDDVNEVYMTLDVKLRVHLFTGATNGDCHKIAQDVMNGETNDRIDNVELLEWEPWFLGKNIGKNIDKHDVKQ